LIKANDTQLGAIKHVNGPMMVLAGPGSGKTTVITERIRYLIEEQNIPPDQILVITFTNAAAVQMKERFQKTMEEQFLPVTFATFHAFYFHILQHTYEYEPQNILCNEEKFKYLAEIIDEQKIDTLYETEWMLNILSGIGRYKSNLCMHKKNNAHQLENIDSELFEKVRIAYEKKCEEEHKLDFDDMILICYKLLITNQDVLEAWRMQYRYIMIDEFQDINSLQYEIIKLLSAPLNNLFIVGDDDQSIYGFRGARPEIMHDFVKAFPSCHRVILNKNYRSTEEIVRMGSRLIKNNKNRFQKNMVSVRGKGAEVIVKVFENTQEEINEIFDNMMSLSVEYNFSELSILYRTSIVGSMLAEQMLLRQIPFQIRDRISNIYQHMVAKDIVAYISLACGNRERKTLLRIMNKPTRYISRTIVRNTIFSFDELINECEGKEYAKENIKRFQYDINMLKKMQPYSGIHYIAKGIGYEKYLTKYAIDCKVPLEQLQNVLEQLKQNAKLFSTYEEWIKHIENFSDKINKHKDEKKEGVTLSTLHGAKGLEYEAVFIIDINEGNIPYRKAQLSYEIEEERRLFYVGITRAKSKLYLYSSIRQTEKENRISRFMLEIGYRKGHLFSDSFI